MTRDAFSSPASLRRTCALVMPRLAPTPCAVVAAALMPLLFVAARAWECPTVDEDTQTAVARTCIADPDGLCGDTCFGAVTEAALARSGDDEVPCGEGLDDVIDALSGCMSEVGLTLDECGGKTRQRIRDNAGSIRCEGGGTLRDVLDDA